MDFKLPLAVFSQDAEDHKKRYKENYDPNKNYPKYSGVADYGGRHYQAM